MLEVYGGMKQFESFRLDISNECLWQDSTQVALRPKPFAVLRYLVENPGRLITHEELLDALWPETYVQPQVLRTYMLELRKVLGDEAGQPRFIQTHPKRGYCFVAAVSERCAAEVVEKKLSGVAFALELGAAGIVGRVEELTRLQSQLALAAGGQRQTVFVTGEAGIGKTALVDAFCRQIGGSFSGSIARGQCVEGFGGKEEYYPLMEALGQLCAAADGERVCRVLGRMAPAWLAAMGREVDGSVQRNGPADRMPGDLCAALEELAVDKPLMLVFEDLHWADDSTLRLISALARRRAPAKLTILATYRPHVVQDGSGYQVPDQVREHPLKGIKQDLLLRRLCMEIALAPLGKSAVKELLVREMQQEALPPGLTSFVHQHSEGNPLFVIAIVEHLMAQRFLVRDTPVSQWEQRAAFTEMEASVPEGLAQMIELEMERLTPEEQRLLEAGSLINVAFPAWAVAAALAQDASEIEEACDELARRLYFVERVGQDELPDGSRSAFYVFAHGLYREVLYQRQPAARRARRHMRVAERLGQLFAGRESNVEREIAVHCEAAGNWQCAAKALRAAAKHAEHRQAYAEAMQLLEHAMRIVDNMSNGERQRAAEEICVEMERLGDLVHANEVVVHASKTVKSVPVKA